MVEFFASSPKAPTQTDIVGIVRYLSTLEMVRGPQVDLMIDAVNYFKKKNADTLFSEELSH
eukprot:4187929-Pyramimonas_sp.AAC.1